MIAQNGSCQKQGYDIIMNVWLIETSIFIILYETNFR